MNGTPSRVTRPDIVNGVEANVEFFRHKWRGFCAWAEAYAQECLRYEEEQNGEYYRVAEEMQKVRRVCNAAWNELVLQKGELRAKHQETHRKWQERQKELKAKGWIYCDGHGAAVKVSGYLSFYVPETLLNPAAVLLYDLPRDDLDTEKCLLLDCALLSVTHDTQPGLESRAQRVYPTSYEGAFERDWFISELKASLGEREKTGELARAWNRVRSHPPQGETPQAEGKPKKWKPPKGYTGAKSTGIPRSTLEGWEQQDEAPGHPLYGKVKQDCSTREKYYPNSWLKKRRAHYTPRKKSP